jgi:hypothetical protein
MLAHTNVCQSRFHSAGESDYENRYGQRAIGFGEEGGVGVYVDRVALLRGQEELHPEAQRSLTAANAGGDSEISEVMTLA